MRRAEQKNCQCVCFTHVPCEDGVLGAVVAVRRGTLTMCLYCAHYWAQTNDVLFLDVQVRTDQGEAMNLDKPVFKIGDKFFFEMPEEPPLRSVVIDGEGNAWQSSSRDDDEPATWMLSDGYQTLARSWRKIVIDNGPLTLVHVGVPTAHKNVNCEDVNCDGGC